MTKLKVCQKILKVCVEVLIAVSLSDYVHFLMCKLISSKPQVLLYAWRAVVGLLLENCMVLTLSNGIRKRNIPLISLSVQHIL